MEGMRDLSDKLVQTITSDLVVAIEEMKRDGIITVDSLETTNRNYMNETHSVIVGKLFSVVDSRKGKIFNAAIPGHGLRTKESKGGKKFVPDITLWKWNREGKEIVGVIDYESTNSSDSRIVTRDFKNYQRFVENHSQIPSFWLVITTLPQHPVDRSDWYSWDYRRGRASSSGYAKMIANPFDYWYAEYRTHFSELMPTRKKCPLYLANLDWEGVHAILPASVIWRDMH
jgi:hypothetical protein